MSSDKIRLPDFLIADLYKGNLVDIAAVSQSLTKKEKQGTDALSEVPVAGQLAFLGENRKNVTILVNQSSKQHIDEAELTFLTNVLKACNLTLADIAIVNTANQKTDFKALQTQLSPKHLLLFDVEATAVRLPFKTPPFQVQAFDGSSIMTAPALSAMNQSTTDSTNLKRLLWTGLKKMFNIG